MANLPVIDVDVLADKIADRVADRVVERLDQRPVLRMGEAAERIGVERRTLYDIVKRGELRTVTVGKRQGVEQAEIDRYLAANRR